VIELGEALLLDELLHGPEYVICCTALSVRYRTRQTFLM
jgi:hypothetical protein